MCKNRYNKIKHVLAKALISTTETRGGKRQKSIYSSSGVYLMFVSFVNAQCLLCTWILE